VIAAAGRHRSGCGRSANRSISVRRNACRSCPQPEALTAAAGTLQLIGSSVSGQNAAAAAPTTGVVPAAADEVSALTAAQFAAHAQLYQAVSAQAAAIHEMFVNTLGTSAGSYAATEAANAVAAG
jgi:PE family